MHVTRLTAPHDCRHWASPSEVSQECIYNYPSSHTTLYCPATKHQSIYTRTHSHNLLKHINGLMNLKRYGQLILDLFAIVPYIETQKPNEYSSSILCCLQSHAREAHDQARMPESERKMFLDWQVTWMTLEKSTSVIYWMFLILGRWTDWRFMSKQKLSWSCCKENSAE